MAIAYNNINLKKRLGLMSSCLVVLIACSSLGSDEDVTVNEFPSEFVSSELWIENSRELINQKNSEADKSTFYAELPNDDLSIEIILDQEKEVSRVKVPLNSSLSKVLYFDYGRLSFSETEIEKSKYLTSAYADGRAYAHAFSDGSTPSSSQIKQAELSEHKLQAIVSLAKLYSKKEKNGFHNVRISDSEFSIRETVALNEDFTAVMNVKQGERIDIELTSEEPHVYFTISPSMGSDMEHKFWKGNASFTGDIEIRIFTAEDIRQGSFKLDVKRI